jgi:hypothetical protein
MAGTNNNKRKSLAELISDDDEQPAPTPPPPRPERPAEQPTDGPAAETGKPDLRPASASPRRPPTKSRTPRLPKYKTMERKEVLARGEQLDELTALRRRLNRARSGSGERITENTLVRVAIDLLLAHADQLSGATEEELRESVTPGVQKK